MSPDVTRREFIGTAVGTAVASSAAAAQLAGASPPNVLFILADDLGYGDLSCYGRPDYRTPVLDAFARQGIKFMSAYAAAPVCTPTRCAFVDRELPAAPRRRTRGAADEPNSPTDAGLPPDHPTVASLLKKNGYDTALIGKWHLGWKPEFGPNRHGYDEFFGILSGAADYFTHGAGLPGATAGRPVGEPDAGRTRRLPHRSVVGPRRRIHRPPADAGRSISACTTPRRTRRGKDRRTRRSITRRTAAGR